MVEENSEFCGCTSLKKGCIIISFLTGIASIVSIITGAVSLNNCINHHASYKYKDVCYYYGYSSVVSGSLILVSSVLLYAGIKRNNRYMMWPCAILMLLNAFSYFLLASRFFTEGFIFFGFSSIAAAIIDCIFGSCIDRYDKKLKNRQTRERFAVQTARDISPSQNPIHPGQMGYPAPYQPMPAPAPYQPMPAPAPYPSNFPGYGVQNNGFAPDPMMGQSKYNTNPMNSNGSPYPSGPNVGSYPAPPPYSPHPETNSFQQLANSSNSPNLTNAASQPPSTSNSNQPSAPDFSGVPHSSLSNNENKEKF